MFKRRGLLIYPEEISTYWSELLIGSGLNLIGIHPAGGKDAARSLDRLLEEVKTEKFKEFAETLISHGFSFEYEFHALSWLIPRDLFETQPEWFRMNEQGERVNDFNMCPSNQDALEHLENRSAELAAQLPYSSDRYFFWLDDVKNASCHCASCRDLSPSDQALILHNHILRGIRKTNRSASACYLAYLDTLPVPEKVRPDKGIFLEYAPITRDSSIPISDQSCVNNKREASYIDDLLSFFGKENSQVLEYWIDNSRYCNWRLPLKKLDLNMDVLREDARFYAEKGFSSATSFACYLGEDYAKEFGAPPITEYAEILNSIVCQHATGGKH
jgi:hypothetical protein